MALACVICFGSYFVYDTPSALQLQLTADFDMSDLQFNLLYSIYSLPNIFLPFFSGVFIDKVGVRPGLVLFATLIVVSQVLSVLGASLKYYWVLLLGRFVLGLGGESLSGNLDVVAQSTMTSKWFLGKELALAMGLGLSISRLVISPQGSVMNDWIEPSLVATSNLSLGLSLGLLLCCLSLVAAFYLYKIDEERDRIVQPREELLSPLASPSFKLNFSAVFWLLTANAVLAYICVLSFNNIASSYFHDRFGCSVSQTGLLIVKSNQSVTYLTAALCTPALGYFVDQVQNRSVLSKR
jgi:MFS family permease